MSVTNNKAPMSIFDIQESNDSKERQRLEELKRQAKVQQVKLNKKLNKQKILMGTFLGQVLATEGDDEQMIRDYFAMNFPGFLTRASDKQLFKSMIESLGGDMGLEEQEDSFVANTKKSDPKAAGQSVSVEDSDTKNKQQPPFDTATNYGEQDSLLEDGGYSADENNQGYRG